MRTVAGAVSKERKDIARSSAELGSHPVIPYPYRKPNFGPREGKGQFATSSDRMNTPLSILRSTV
jgi:hypothetical protein